MYLVTLQTLHTWHLCYFPPRQLYTGCCFWHSSFVFRSTVSVSDSLRLIQCSHVSIWVQAANCGLIEIKVSNLLQIHWTNDLHTEMFAKSDLEPFQHHKIHIWYECRRCFVKHIYWLVRFQKPLSAEHLLLGMISVSCIFRKYISCYDFRVLHV